MRVTGKWMTLVVVGIFALAAVPSQVEAQKRQRDRISREEILGSPQKNRDMYEVIRAIRPHFLQGPKGVRTMGNSAIFPPVVYVDGRKESGLDALRLMNPDDVDDVRYLDPSRAESEFGPSANGGAIVIKRYKAPRIVPAAIADTTKPPRTT